MPRRWSADALATVFDQPLPLRRLVIELRSDLEAEVPVGLPIYYSGLRWVW